MDINSYGHSVFLLEVAAREKAEAELRKLKGLVSVLMALEFPCQECGIQTMQAWADLKRAVK